MQVDNHKKASPPKPGFYNKFIQNQKGQKFAGDTFWGGGGVLARCHAGDTFLKKNGALGALLIRGANLL